MEIKPQFILQAINCAINNICITDKNGTIMWCNDSFAKNTGYSKSELIGANPRVLKHNDTNPSIYKELWETITNKKTWRGKLKNKKKNGEIYIEELSITPILDDNKTDIVGFIGVQNDITEIELQKEKIKSNIFKIQEIIENSTKKKSLNPS